MEYPWSISIEELIEELQVDIQQGLTAQNVSERTLAHGHNVLSDKKKFSRLRVLFKQCKSPIVPVLLIATVIAFIVGEKLDGWAIVSIVILNVLIGYFQEAKAEESIEALSALTAPKSKVLRDGVLSTIESKEVVPGDILVLEAGDFVPADARLIKVSQLTVQEAVLTGESLPVEKHIEALDRNVTLPERTNMIFAGTALSTGSTHAIVTSTGKETELGKIAEMMVSTETPETPLQLRLAAVSNKLLWLGGFIILLVSIIGFFQNLTWIEILMAGLSLSIAAIPEGLPTVVTIALVMAVRRMSHRKALVRKIDAVETLGGTDIICTDKTGTLTTGSMKVRESFIQSPDQEELFYLDLVLCNNASIRNGSVGDTTEIALLEYARLKGFKEEIIKAKYPRLKEWSFESDRKRMSVVCRIEDKDMVLTKGAPESVIVLCNLNDESKQEMLHRVEDFSRKGMRVLGFAFKELSSMENDLSVDDVESGLTFMGLVAIADPPRADSIEAIKKCQSAGIRIMMITGDHPQTAAAIAQELGIIKDGENVLTGKDFEALSDEELKLKSQEISVYARVSPEHKYRLVNALKSMGHVVAMTGDGVNDAPALKTASIGISMGFSGTEVARQASSMILTDDNFSTIVNAVEEGRAVNGNIKRTLQYLLSTNLAELVFILISLLFGLPVPLLPINLLWLNLVSDGLPSLALAAEVVPPEFLEHSKRPSDKTFFDRTFYQEMFFVSFVITFMSLGVYYYGVTHYDLITARSLAFSFLVYVVLFRSFSCRSESLTFFEMKPNKFHLLSVSIPILFQILIQKVDILSNVFKVKELSLVDNLLLIFLSCIPVTMVEGYKILKRKSRLV